LWAHATAATGAFNLAGLAFDYPLRLVEVVYAARGLAPYADFGFLYPLGLVWFYGKLLRLQDPGVINAAIILGNLLLVSICAWQVMRLTQGSWRRLFGGTVFLVLGGATASGIANPVDMHLGAVLPLHHAVSAGVQTRPLASQSSSPRSYKLRPLRF
jgi:hypothetical protein